MASVIPIRQVKDQTEADLLRQGWRKACAEVTSLSGSTTEIGDQVAARL